MPKLKYNIETSNGPIKVKGDELKICQQLGMAVKLRAISQCKSGIVGDKWGSLE